MLFALVEKILPAWIFRRLRSDWNEEGFKKYLNNTSWLYVAKVFSVAVSFFTIAVLARYLGPDNFGKLSYAQSFVALFSVLGSLGINQILYRELSANPDEEAEILGTAFFATMFLGGLTVCVTVLTGIFLHDDIILTWLVGIIALQFVIQPFGILGLFFQSKVKAKYPAIMQMIVSVFIPVAKLGIVWLDQGILYLAGVILLESVIYMVGYLFVYTQIFERSVRRWKLSLIRLKKLLADAWPLALASLSGYVYGRIDQVMIQNYVDVANVAYYDIAVRLTEFACYLPGVIVGSVFPALVSARKKDPAQYQRRFQSLSILTTGIAACSAVVLVISAPYLINIIFGSAYSAVVPVITIYAWSAAGIVSVLLIQQYFIIENRARAFLGYSVAGAIINVGLNLYLIPREGIQGAAIATIITFAAITAYFLLVERPKSTPVVQSS